jgi:hypothetical protein
VLRCGRGVSFGLAIALRNALKNSWNGPAFTTPVAVISVKINNQTTIASRCRFTKTASCRALVMRALRSSLVLPDERGVMATRGELPGCLGTKKSRKIHQIPRLFIGDSSGRASIDDDAINQT